MWRICNCAQPLVGGCKRCQFPTELNRNIRGMGSTPPKQPTTKIPNEPHPRWNQLANNYVQKEPEQSYGSYTEYCRLRNSYGNSSCKPEARAKTEQHMINSRRLASKIQRNRSASAKTEVSAKRNLVRNQSPMKSSWISGSRKIIDRLRDMWFVPKSSPDQEKSEQFFDCEEPPFAKTDKLSADIKSKGIMKAKSKLIQEVDYEKARISELSEAAKCNPLDSPSLKPLDQYTPNSSKAMRKGSHSGYTRTTDVPVKQSPEVINPMHRGQPCEFCGIETKSAQKTEVFPDNSKSAKPKLQLEPNNRLQAAYCKVNAVQLRLKNPSDFKSIQSPQQCYDFITSVLSSNSTQVELPKVAMDLSAPRANPLPAGEFCCSQGKSVPYSTDSFPKSISKRKPILVSKMLPFKSERLNSDKQHSKEDNILFNKLKALPFLNEILPSRKETCLKPPFSKNPKTAALKWFESDSNYLFSKVKKSSSDAWREKQEELKKWEKSVEGKIPMKTRPANAYDLEKMNKYASDIQKQNIKRNRENQLVIDPLDAERENESISKQRNLMDFTSSRSAHSKSNAKDTRFAKANLINEQLRMQLEKQQRQDVQGQQETKPHGLETQPPADVSEQTSDMEFDIDRIDSEVNQINKIIQQCELLKSKYAKRLEAERVQRFQGPDKLQQNKSILQRTCMESMVKQKEVGKNDRLVVKKSKKNLEKEPFTLPVQSKCKTCQGNKPRKESHFKKTVQRNKTCQTKIDNEEKMWKETDKTQESGGILKGYWEDVRWKGSREANRKKDAKMLKKSQERRSGEESGKLRKPSVEQKLNAREIKQQAANIEKIYNEAKRKVAELEQQLKKTCKNHLTSPRGKCQHKGKRTDNDDDGLNKFILSPWHRHNDGVSVTTSWKSTGCAASVASGWQMLCSQNQRGKLHAGGLLDALGMPFGQRLDSKFYLFDLQNCLARVDYLQQRQSSILSDEDECNIEPHYEGESLIVQWVRKFAELPLQLRPGSKILIPLPHSKGGYFIGESDERSSTTWTDLKVDQEFEYDEPDY